MTSNHSGYLLWAILAGVVLGIICGAWFGPAMLGVEWLGTLFLNALKMMIIPLIIAAVVTGVASLGDVRKLGRVGGFTVLYYASTTAVAVILGHIKHPGDLIASRKIVVCVSELRREFRRDVHHIRFSAFN